VTSEPILSSARLLLLIAVLLPAACAAEKPVQLSSAPPPLETGFLSPDMVEVTLRDPQPVVAAALIDPEGHAFPAGPIAHARESEAPSEGIPPQVELGASGGSAGLDSAGIGIGLPVFGSPGTPAGSVMVSRFTIRIADMTAYRASWQKWKFHLTLGSTKSNQRDIEFLGPRPPE
jgi:hypothetical protein